MAALSTEHMSATNALRPTTSSHLAGVAASSAAAVLRSTARSRTSTSGVGSAMTSASAACLLRM